MRRLQRELVMREALALVDEIGLDGLTVRRLAERLGVQNPALYRHFANKQDLLDHMAEMILVNAFADFHDDEANRTWDEWLMQFTLRYRAALMSHRDGARIIASANLESSALLEGLAQAMQILLNAGFDEQTARSGILTLTDYALGSALEAQGDPRRLPSDTDTAAPTPSPGIYRAEAGFVAGVELIRDGLRARLGKKARNPA